MDERRSSHRPAIWCFGPSPTEESTHRPSRNAKPSTLRSHPPKQRRLLRFGSLSFSLVSPRVGCAGQIMGRKTSSSSRSSSSSSSSSSFSSSSNGLWKFKMAPLWRSASAKEGGGRREEECGVAEEMDPPLPVVRRQRRREEEELGSIWQRRRACQAAADGLRIELPPLAALVF